MLGTLNSRQIDQVLRSEIVGRLGCYRRWQGLCHAHQLCL